MQACVHVSTKSADGGDPVGTTGDPFDFHLKAIDNTAVGDVYVYVDLGTGYVEYAMDGSKNYNTTITIPADYVGFMDYYFVVYDTLNNTNTTIVTFLIITDNDAPIGLNDLSDITGTTGDPFNFAVNVTDNVGVNQVTLTYWFGTDNSTEQVLIGADPYTGSIAVQLDSQLMGHPRIQTVMKQKVIA